VTSELASRLQHTNVRPEATRSDIERLLAECLEHGFDGAMVNPIWVPLAADVLRGSGVHVCTALDFPMGGGTTASVSAAVAEVRRLGADQIDVMTRPGWLRSGMEAEYRDHLAAVVIAAEGAPVKAMLEAALLSPDELERAVELCVETDVAWIKNSSGFGGGDATPDLVATLHALASGRVHVKASGGIRSGEAARTLLDAGAELLGSSASVAIVGGSAAPGSDDY
jgi:deoxyribose-phosphate aldolase